MDVLLRFENPQLLDLTVRVATPERTISISERREIAIKILSSSTNAPVPGALVTSRFEESEGPYTLEGTSDSNGELVLVLPDLDAIIGPSIVMVKAAGFRTPRVQIAVLATKDLTIKLVPEGGLCGHLIRSYNDPVV
jgi:hypothetical protein